MIGIGRLGIRDVERAVDEVDGVGFGGREERMANGFSLVASFLYFRTFRFCFGWLQQGHRVDAGRLQQGCRQILGNLDETRFQIIFSIRPHEMYWTFLLTIVTFYLLHQHFYCRFFSKEREMRSPKPTGCVSGGRLARFGGKYGVRVALDREEDEKPMRGYRLTKRRSVSNCEY